MEPLFFKAENRTRVTGAWGELELQWSRFFSKRKITMTVRKSRGVMTGFNGAAFFQSGKFRASDVLSDQGRYASMEPLFFKAENRARLTPMISLRQSFNGAAFFQSGKLYLPLVRTARQEASMEPLFFKAENILNIAAAKRCFLLLQWSRFFSKRKIIRYRRDQPERPRGFNGAAFFQSGKC